MNTDKTVCVMGLGYVGLPLAEAFSKHIKVIGYDIDEKRLKMEVAPTSITYSSDPSSIKQALRHHLRSYSSP